MSGGHYDYGYSHITQLADNIERSFIQDGVQHDYDYLGDANIYQKEAILREVRSLIKDLNAVAKRAKELEWYMSGDTGPETYLKRLNEHVQS